MLYWGTWVTAVGRQLAGVPLRHSECVCVGRGTQPDRSPAQLLKPCCPRQSCRQRPPCRVLQEPAVQLKTLGLQRVCAEEQATSPQSQGQLELSETTNNPAPSMLFCTHHRAPVCARHKVFQPFPICRAAQGIRESGWVEKDARQTEQRGKRGC